MKIIIILFLIMQNVVLAKQSSTDLVTNNNVYKEASNLIPFVVDDHDFEVSEGFTVGLLLGQNSWTIIATSVVAPVIATGNASSGDQHIHLINDPAVAAGTLVGGFSPYLGAQPLAETSVVSVDVFVSNSGGASYEIVAQAPSASQLTWRIKFNSDETIQILDVIGANLVLADSGATWPINTYFNIRVATNPIVNSIEYYLNDNLIYTSVAGIFAAQTIEQVVLLSNNDQLVDEFADFDNLKIDTTFIEDLIFANGFESELK